MRGKRVPLVAEGADPDFGVVVDGAEGVQHPATRSTSQRRVIQHCHGRVAAGSAVQGRVERCEGNVALVGVQLRARPDVPGHANAVDRLGVQKLRHRDDLDQGSPTPLNPQTASAFAAAAPGRGCGALRPGAGVCARWSSEDVRASTSFDSSGRGFQRDDRRFVGWAWAPPCVSPGDPDRGA